MPCEGARFYQGGEAEATVCYLLASHTQFSSAPFSWGCKPSSPNVSSRLPHDWVWKLQTNELSEHLTPPCVASEQTPCLAGSALICCSGCVRPQSGATVYKTRLYLSGSQQFSATSVVQSLIRSRTEEGCSKNQSKLIPNPTSFQIKKTQTGYSNCLSQLQGQG